MVTARGRIITLNEQGKEREHGKSRKINRLLADTYHRITSSPVEWQKFLETSGRLSKYWFTDQMLMELAERAADEFINSRITPDSRKTFGGLFKDSVKYMVASRCGIAANELAVGFDFSDISQNGSEKHMEVINAGFQTAARPLITAIGKEVFKYDRAERVRKEREAEHDRVYGEGRADVGLSH